MTAECQALDAGARRRSTRNASIIGTRTPGDRRSGADALKPFVTGGSRDDCQAPFLAGTFLEMQGGFRLAAAPPFDGLRPGGLKSENPFVVLAAALERAKRGEFTALGRLSGLMKLVRRLRTRE